MPVSMWMPTDRQEGEEIMPTEKIYNNIEKGEHFHGNNPDMELNFAKPDKAEIDEMNYKKPITSYKDGKQKGFEYMDGSEVMRTPNSDFIADKGNYAKGDKFTNTPEGSKVSSGTGAGGT